MAPEQPRPPASPSCAPTAPTSAARDLLTPTLWWWLLPQLPAAPTAAGDAALPTALLSPTKALGQHPRSPQAPQQEFLCWPSRGTSLSDSMVIQTRVERPLRRELRPPNQTTDTQEAPKGPNLVPLSDQLLSQLLSPGQGLAFGSPPLLQAQLLTDQIQCRTELSGSRAARSSFVQPSQGTASWDPGGDGPWWVWYSRSSSGAAECPGQGRARRAAGSGVTQQISPQSTHFSVPTTIPPDFRMDRTRR